MIVVQKNFIQLASDTMMQIREVNYLPVDVNNISTEEVSTITPTK